MSCRYGAGGEVRQKGRWWKSWKEVDVDLRIGMMEWARERGRWRSSIDLVDDGGLLVYQYWSWYRTGAAFEREALAAQSLAEQAK